MKKIGLRNIKTAIAVVVTMIVLMILGSDNYFYACIAAVITMQMSVYESFKAGKHRMIGTTIGVGIGIVLASISPDNILLVGLGTSLVIYFCDLLKYKESVNIACIVFIAIMVNLKDMTPFEYGIERLVETFIGIAVAVAVNYVIAKNESTKKVLEHYNRLKNEIIDVFKSVILDRKNKNYEVLKNHIIQFQNLINSLEIDCNHISNKEFNEEIEQIREKIELFKEVNIHIKIIHYIEEKSEISKENKVGLKKLFGDNEVLDEMEVIEVENSEMSKDAVVFNYHLEKIIEILEKVNEPFKV